MAINVIPAIPASQIVNVLPSVLPAGGTALDLIGLFLTKDTRAPIGQVIKFADQKDVADYFGSTSQMAALASVYFLGPNNKTNSPAAMLAAQYPASAVAAWLRSGTLSGMTIADLQALNATLNVTIDAVLKTATINLAAATSFSNAAELIGVGLGIEGVSAGSVTGSIGGTFTCTSSSTTLTVTAVLTGTLQTGATVSGSDGTNSLPGATTIVSQLTGTTGGTGTYQLSAPAAPGGLTSCTVTASSKTLNVTAVGVGTTVSVGDVLSGSGVTANTYVASQVSGTTGGIGVYSISNAMTVASETINLFTPAVQYDSIQNAFVIYSGTTGITSTIGYGSGALGVALKLDQPNGAVISPGAAATDPTTFMDSVTDITQNWAEFTTTWEPVTADKEGFADWNNAQNNRYVYEMWDSNIVNTESGGPSAAVAYVNNGSLSGVVMTYDDTSIDTVGGIPAAFGMGWTASLDFGRHNGRQTQAFRRQSGILPQILRATPALQLISFGINFFGDYTTANDSFKIYYPGSISGDFKWKDSYVNQIQLNNQLQLAIFNGLVNVNSIPYNTVGKAMIEGWCRDPINQALNFGSIVAGITLSEAQKIEVNTAAGVDIDKTLTNQGWYMQVSDATAQVRAARTSPPCTLWYCDGGSIQQITLASIEIQ